MSRKTKNQLRSMMEKTGKRARGAANILARERLASATRLAIAAPTSPTTSIHEGYVYMSTQIRQAVSRLFDRRPDGMAFTTRVNSYELVDDRIGPNGEVAMVPLVDVSLARDVKGYWWFKGALGFVDGDLYCDGAPVNETLFETVAGRKRLSAIILQQEPDDFASRVASFEVEGGYRRGDNLIVLVNIAFRDTADAGLYEHEADVLAFALQAHLPGSGTVSMGPGPMAAVRFHVEGTSVVFIAILHEGKIMSSAMTEHTDRRDEGILWGVRERPLTVDGARQTAALMIEWWQDAQAKIRELERWFSAHSTQQLRIALHQVGSHPLRGDETSRDAVTDHGKVKDGQPAPGVTIRWDGDEYRFRLTEVSGDVYSWDELTMSSSSFGGFVDAMRDLLRHR